MSVTVTPAAGASPALSTVIVYVTGSPVPYGGGEGDFVIETSTLPPEIVVDAVDELLPGVGSAVVLLTVTVLLMVVPPGVETAA